MHDMPLVSIISPVYNGEKFLKQSIESVLNQTYLRWELILVDDCSKDSSREIIEEYVKSDSRIKGYYLNKNSGAGASRNIGLEVVKGDFIAFLDSDDFWQANKLSMQVDFLLTNSYEMTYSWYNTVDEEGNLKNYFVTPERINFNLLKYNNYILTSSLMISKNLLGNSRFPVIRKRQDWAFFLDLLKKIEFAYCLPKITVNYRKSSKSLSSNKWLLIKPNYQFFKDYLFNGNSILSVIHFIVFIPFYFHNKLINRKKINQ